MYPIGEAAKKSGVHIETIRYYEREGIVPAAERTASGRRVYDAVAIARLRFVRRCRDLGFSITDIRAFLDLSDSPDRSCAEVRVIGERHLTEVRARLADLMQLETALVELVDQCADEQRDCPALKRLFAD